MNNLSNERENQNDTLRSAHKTNMVWKRNEKKRNWNEYWRRAGRRDGLEQENDIAGSIRLEHRPCQKWLMSWAASPFHCSTVDGRIDLMRAVVHAGLYRSRSRPLRLRSSFNGSKLDETKLNQTKPNQTKPNPKQKWQHGSPCELGAGGSPHRLSYVFNGVFCSQRDLRKRPSSLSLSLCRRVQVQVFFFAIEPWPVFIKRCFRGGGGGGEISNRDGRKKT